MRAVWAACLSLGLIGGVSAAQAASSLRDRGLLQLVSGDGLDRDAAATGNDRTGGMWENATGGTGSWGYRGGWGSVPHYAYHRHHAVHRRWW